MSSSAAVLREFDRYDDENDIASSSARQAGAEATDNLPSSSKATYQFTPKFQHSVKNNPLCGITFPEWVGLLRRRWKDIEWRTYWPRLVVLTILSGLNSLLALPEYLFYSKRISKTEINPRPVFILGHPRTGTTMLHSLLALDTEQFSICTTFCSGFPSSFLWLEQWGGKKVFAGVMDETRPMDNVPLDFDLPQEDELATNVWTASDPVSPYMALFFMTDEPSFRPFFAFDDNSDNSDERLSPERLAAARKRWTSAFLYLLKKLTLRDQLLHNQESSSSRRRLVLKSPVHTGRIRLLLNLFPDAQFIFIHRHPAEVFQSAAHMADTTYWYTYMTTPSSEQIQEFILRQYEILWERYQQDKQLLKQNQLIEVSYEELSEKPIQTLERIYQTLEWDVSLPFRQRLQEQLSEHNIYQRNRHSKLPEALLQLIEERWGHSYDTLGYPRECT